MNRSIFSCVAALTTLFIVTTLIDNLDEYFIGKRQTSEYDIASMVKFLNNKQ